MSAIKLSPIGRIEADEAGFRIVLTKESAPGLSGLSGFSHVQILWWFDGCDGEADRSALTQKKPYTDGPETLGTFATRSPRRPNPIAVTTAGILAVDEAAGILTVDYLDALDGTPVLDLKPYTPSLDRVESPTVPSWCARWPKSLETSGDYDWEGVFSPEET